MNKEAAQLFIDQLWDDSITPSLYDYIKIPCKSPDFDPDWEAHGYIEEGVQHIVDWLEHYKQQDMTLEVVRLAGRTPLILMEIPATGGASDDTVLLYGHMDKQPEMVGWDEDLGPWIPVIKDDKLYGRGGADDGYAAYASLTAILALREQNIPHARCVMLIEACEESGSYDLPFYVEHLREKIGKPSLVICLDSGAGNYEQLWMTVSLRGMASGTLRADVLTEGVHSGAASGVVPSSMRVLRQLLDRLESSGTGEILLQELQVDLPEQRRQQIEKMSAQLGDEIVEAYPFVDGVQPMGESHSERIINRTWKPTLSIVGQDGLPSLQDGGNVLRPHISLKLSFRLPPTADSARATQIIKETLEENPPLNASVSFDADGSADGWNAPDVAPWLDDCLQNASQEVYGREALYMGEGGDHPIYGDAGRGIP